MMKEYKAIIYDIDGTLLDTLKMNMIPLQRIIKEELHEDWTYEEVLKFAPYPGMKVMEELNVKDKNKTYARWVKYVNEFEDGATPYPNVEDVLETAHERGIRQAVVSAKLRKQYEIDFISKGFNKYIEVEVLADDTDKHKPAPEPIELCLKKLGLNKEDVIYIGDALSDYQVCINAGIDFAYAKWGSVSDEGILTTIVLEEPLDILKLIVH